VYCRWDVDGQIEALTKLGHHKQLNFFDMNTAVSLQTPKKHRLNTMLPHILDGVLENQEVMARVKLPLAIRLDDVNPQASCRCL